MLRIKIKDMNFWVPDRHKWVGMVYGEVFTTQIYSIGGCKVEEGDTVVDVGANVGVFSLYAFARNAGKVIAVEPEPECINCLNANVRAYGVEDKTDVVDKVAWNKNETVTLMSVLDSNVGGHFVKESVDKRGQWKSGDPNEGKKYKVEGVRLDDVINEKIDFVKIDAEGSELEILEGMEGLLKEYRPKMSIAAYHRKTDVADFRRLLKKYVPEYRIENTQKTSLKVVFAWEES